MQTFILNYYTRRSLHLRGYEGLVLYEVLRLWDRSLREMRTSRKCEPCIFHLGQLRAYEYEAICDHTCTVRHRRIFNSFVYGKRRFPRKPLDDMSQTLQSCQRRVEGRIKL